MEASAFKLAKKPSWSNTCWRSYWRNHKQGYPNLQVVPKVSAQNHLQWVNTTWMLNLEVQPQSSCVIEIDSPHNTHLDLQPSRVKKDETDIQSVVELLQTSWTNPFKKIRCNYSFSWYNWRSRYAYAASCKTCRWILDVQWCCSCGRCHWYLHY